MIKHKIYVRRAKQGIGRDFYPSLIRRSVRAALAAENVEIPCEISILITDSHAIQEINREQRGIDKVTDVLSFPMQELEAGNFHVEENQLDPDSGRLYLGDIVLNIDKVYSQAEEYGHDKEREITYLVVHSVLHLLGYDHEDEGEKKAIMRAREEEILRDAGSIQ